MRAGCHNQVVTGSAKIERAMLQIEASPVLLVNPKIGIKRFYSSPRRRRGALPRLHSGHGEIAPVVSAAGAVEPAGTIQS